MNTLLLGTRYQDLASLHYSEGEGNITQAFYALSLPIPSIQPLASFR